MTVALRQELATLSAPVAVCLLNPGAFDTAMLQGQKPGEHNAFFETAAKVPGTLFGPALNAGAKVANDYMSRNANRSSAMIGDCVWGIVHSPTPRDRYVIGASFEMRFVVPYLPQFVLDTAIRLSLR